MNEFEKVIVQLKELTKEAKKMHQEIMHHRKLYEARWFITEKKPKKRSYGAFKY